MAANKEIKVTKKDVVWNYIAQVVNFGSGLFLLPLILNRLSAVEVGMNYLMQSVVFMIALISAEFSRQLGRNITYVLSGAQTIEKEGVSNNVIEGKVDYHLLKVILSTTQTVYRVIALVVLALMLTAGSVYMYNATDGFSNVENSLTIWILFSISTFINIYFTYYNSFLSGAAMVMEYNKVTILTRMTYILVSIALLLCGYGLISVVIGHLVSPFLGYIYAHSRFFSPDMKENLQGYKATKEEIKKTFNTIWYTAKKNIVDCFGLYLVNQSGTLLIGGFLTLVEVASYGLMLQLFQILASLSRGVFASYLPMLFKHRVQKDTEKFMKDFSFSMFVFWVTYIIGGFVIIYLAPPVLGVIRSNSELPIKLILYIYMLNGVLEINHELCSNAIVAKNEVPFMKASLIGGICVFLVNFITLKFTVLGMLGVVVGQLLVQSAYNHWKWPKYILDDIGISFLELYVIGCKETVLRGKRIIKSFSI